MQAAKRETELRAQLDRLRADRDMEISERASLEHAHAEVEHRLADVKELEDMLRARVAPGARTSAPGDNTSESGNDGVSREDRIRQVTALEARLLEHLHGSEADDPSQIGARVYRVDNELQAARREISTLTVMLCAQTEVSAIASQS